MSRPESDGFKKLVVELMSWDSYSSLQKLVALFLASCVLSVCSSFWTLTCTFCVSLLAGYKLSQQILHHDKASVIAEQVFDKIESIYLQVSKYVCRGRAFINNVATGKHSITSLQATEEMHTDDDTQSEGSMSPMYADLSTPITLPCDVGQELNSIQLLILRDFIRSWYADYSYDPTFLKETKLLLHQTFNNLVSRIAQQKAEHVITQVVKLFMGHVADFQKARNSFQSHKIHPETKVATGATIQRHSSVDEAFESLRTFHCALESDQIELEYVKGVMSLFIVCTCNNHVIKGVCARTLLVDILSNNIMLPLARMMANPVWLMEVVIRVTSYEDKQSEACDSYSKCDNIDPDSPKLEDFVGCEEQDASSVVVNHKTKSDDLCEESVTVEKLKNSDRESSRGLTHSDTFHTCDGSPDEVLREDCHGKSQEESPRTNKTEDGVISSKNSSSNCAEELDPVTNGFQEIAHVYKTESSVDEESTLHNQDETSLKNSVPNPQPSKSLSESTSDVDSLNSVQPDAETENEDSEQIGADYDYLENLQVDPQKIISFRSSNSEGCEDLNLISAANDSDASAEQSGNSFPKLSSLKHFFVDTLKPSSKQQEQQAAVKKPKTLSIISGITSNLNPLSSKSSKSSAAEVKKTTSSTTPRVLVDGVSVSEQHAASNHHSEGASLAPDKNQAQELTTPALSDTDASPGTGFFSNINSFFSFSASSNLGSNLESGCDASTLSPMLTPSPTAKDAPAATSQEESLNFDSADVWDNAVKSYILDDRRIFQDVSIPETIIGTEYRSSNQYSLYIIQYEALYFSEEGKSIIRSGTVRRRYREFTNLQSRLENQNAYKQFMKKIRGPKRWPSLPFKSIDKDTVETRRIFLEKYLKDLTEIEAICNGPDIREFLAYEGDSHIAFVKKSPEINVPRLDKMLIRGVSEVVDRIKAIPNNAQEVISGLRSRETPEDKPGAKPVAQYDADMFEINYHFARQEESESCNLLWASCTSTMEDSCSDEEEDLFNISKVLSDQKTTDKMEEVYRQEVEKVLDSLPRSKGGSTEQKNDPESESSLGAAVIDLLVQGLQGSDHWLNHDRVVQSVQAVLGKALNRYLESSIANLTSQEQLTFYLLTLRETIWPQGQLWTEKASSSSSPSALSSTTTTTTTTSATATAANSRQDSEEAAEAAGEEMVSLSTEAEEERQRLEVTAKAGRAVGSMFPESIKLAIGKSEFENLIKVFLESLQSEQLNRNLLYHILDQLLEHLFPEVATFDLVHNLLFSSLSPRLTMPRLVKQAEKL